MLEIKGLNLQTARRAYYWTSMDPDKRGERELKDFATTMESMLEQIKAIPNIGDNWEEEFKTFNEKAQSLRTAYLYSHSNVASTFVTGGSGFNVARNEKKSRWADNKDQAYRDFVNGAISKITKKYKVVVSREDKTSLKEKALNVAIHFQETMKQSNKIVKGKGTKEEKLKALEAIGVPQEVAVKLFEPSFTNEIGFMKYQLTNNGATIRRLTKELEEEQRYQEKSETEFNAPEGVRVEANTELERVMLFFDGKPEEDIRNILKKNAFKWSPKNGAWQRILTDNAIIATKRMLERMNQK